MLGVPERADPEIAAATFAADLEKFWESGRPDELGITRKPVSPLLVLIGIPAIRETGIEDKYFVLLGAEYYARWPPTAAFVDPETLEATNATSRWWPRLRQNPSWAALHNTYHFQSDGKSGQMICFSFTAEYYRSAHSPGPSEVWRQGEHTVAATISRIAELLRQPYYGEPSA